MTKRRSSSLNSTNQKASEATETGQPINSPQEPAKSSQPDVERLAKEQPNPIANEPIDVPSSPVEDETDSSKLHTSAAPKSNNRVEIKLEKKSETKSGAKAEAKAETQPEKKPTAEPDKSTANLEVTIAELKAHLITVQQTAARRETELQEQVDRLQADLQTKQTQINKLQAELDQTHHLKAELEDAKKMILQLSQINAQPAPPVATPKTQPAEPEFSTMSQPVRSQPLPPAPLHSPPPVKEPRSAYPLAARQTDRAIARGSLPAMSSEPAETSAKQNSKLSDMDLGWVD
jgi:hypothetical protein